MAAANDPSGITAGRSAGASWASAASLARCRTCKGSGRPRRCAGASGDRSDRPGAVRGPRHPSRRACRGCLPHDPRVRLARSGEARLMFMGHRLQAQPAEDQQSSTHRRPPRAGPRECRPGLESPRRLFSANYTPGIPPDLPGPPPEPIDSTGTCLRRPLDGRRRPRMGARRVSAGSGHRPGTPISAGRRCRVTACRRRA